MRLFLVRLIMIKKKSNRNWNKRVVPHIRNYLRAEWIFTTNFPIATSLDRSVYTTPCFDNSYSTGLLTFILLVRIKIIAIISFCHALVLSTCCIINGIIISFGRRSLLECKKLFSCYRIVNSSEWRNNAAANFTSLVPSNVDHQNERIDLNVDDHLLGPYYL